MTKTTLKVRADLECIAIEVADFALSAGIPVESVVVTDQQALRGMDEFLSWLTGLVGREDIPSNLKASERCMLAFQAGHLARHLYEIGGQR